MKVTTRKLSFLVRKPGRILRKYHRLTNNGKTLQHFLLFCMIALFLMGSIFGFMEPWGKRQITSEWPIITTFANESLTNPNFPVWTRISDSVYSYSAFLDMRGVTNRFTTRNIPIRIIGLWKLPPKGPILRETPLLWYHIKDEIAMSPAQYYCRVFYVSNVTGRLESFRGQSLTHRIFEEGLKVFAGTFFNCYINRTIAAVLAGSSAEGLSVSIYPTLHPSAQEYPTKLIPVEIIRNERSNPGPPPLTLCVRPLFGPMDNIVQLKQFISFYSAMGVSEFNFYDFGLSPDARALLKKGAAFTGSKIRIRQWNLPTGNWEELWDYGSLAALNDCVYRNMDKRWVIIVDLDEFLVPQEDGIRTLQGILQNSSRFGNYDQLLVRNTFFCNEFCPKSNATRSELPIFSCFIRAKRIWNVNLRSKFIVNPQNVFQVGHHGVTEFLELIVRRPRVFLKKPMMSRSLSKSYVFPENVLILNHYRECSSISTRKQPILDRLTTVDTTMLKFKKLITIAQNKTWKATYTKNV